MGHLGRQGDLGNHGLNLIGKGFFSDKRLRAFHAPLCTMVIVMTFLSLCRNGTAASGTHDAEAKEREFQFVVLIGLPVSSKGLLDLVE